MLVFDRQTLRHRLDEVCPRCRTIFALTCSERLLPLFELFSMRGGKGRCGDLRAAADRLWNQVSEHIVISDCDFLTSYPTLAPGDDTSRSERTLLDPLAENAVLALGSAWECHVSGESRKAAWAAEQAYEAMDYMAQNLDNIDYRDANGEQALLGSDLVQSELQQQNEILKRLAQVCGLDVEVTEMIPILRERAEENGKTIELAASSM